MSELTELYQEIILDHNKRPRNYRKPDAPTHSAEGFNPLCGDQFTVFLRLEGDQIAEAGFLGEGCAISKASASLMTLHLKGKKVADAKQGLQQVLQMLTASDDTDEPPGLGNVLALKGVRRFPVRVKCATLAWHAAQAALEGQGHISTE